MGSILGAVMGFLKISIYTEDFDKKENREQSLIPFLLQTSLSLSCLLHNWMSQALFREASKRRNKKQEARRKKIEQKIGREISEDKLYTIIYNH